MRLARAIRSSAYATYRGHNCRGTNDGTDTKIEKFYAMVNHNLEFLETSSRIWCCLAGARQQKRLSAGRNHHRATTKYHQKVHSFYEHQRIQACQNNLALTSEISGNFVNDKNPALFPSLPCFESSSGSYSGKQLADDFDRVTMPATSGSYSLKHFF